jgi:hypothetical protein
MKEIGKRFLKDATAKFGLKSGHKQRLSKRHPTTIELITLNGNPSKNASIHDLSTGGARLEIPFAVPIMGQLMFGVRLTESTEIINLSGKVAWVKAIPKTQGRYLVGIQFYNLDWRLDQWLRSQK